MKLKAEHLFLPSTPLKKGCLLYGNNEALIDYLFHNFFSQRLNVPPKNTRTTSEKDILAVSKQTLYVEQSLFEKVELVCIEGVTDKILPLVESYQGDAFLVLVGKNLRSTSKIVKFAQTHKDWQGVGIYGNERSLLMAYLKYSFREINIEEGFESILLQKTDNFLTLHQIVKMVYQLHEDGRSISLETLKKMVFGIQDTSIFNVCDIIISKNHREMLKVFPQYYPIFATQIIPLCRLLHHQLQELLKLKQQMEEGNSAEFVVQKAQPMIPFARRPQMISNLTKWSSNGLIQALIMLNEIEILAKQPKIYSTTQIERTFLKFSKL